MTVSPAGPTTVAAKMRPISATNSALLSLWNRLKMAKYTVLADHPTVIDQVEVAVFAPNPDAAVTLVIAMGFVNVAQVN